MKIEELVKAFNDICEKADEEDKNAFFTSYKTFISESKPKADYTTKALDFLYNKPYSKTHEELFTAIVKAELNEWRFYEFQWKRGQGQYVREVIASVCDYLDKGMTLNDIKKATGLNFDTICCIRAFFDKVE